MEAAGSHKEEVLMPMAQPSEESTKAGFFSECDGVCDCAKTVALGLKNWMGNHKKIIGVVIAAIALQWCTGLPLMGVKMGLDYSLFGTSYAFSAVKVSGGFVLSNALPAIQGAGQMFVAEYTAAYQFVSPYITRAVVQPILVWGTTVYAGYQSIKGIKALSASREAGGIKKCITESASNYKIVKYVLNPLVGTPCRWVWGHTFGGAGTGESV